MKCGKIYSCLNAYADGELSDRLCHTIETHLATCEVCQNRLEEIRRMDELFKTTIPAPPVPDRLEVRIMAEARKRKTQRIPNRDSQLSVLIPFFWFAKLSAPMKVAACAAMLLPLLAGLFFDGEDVKGRNVITETRNDMYGLEWFAPAPPDSISSVYISMTDQLIKKSGDNE